MPFFTRVIYSKLFLTPPYPTHDFTDKVIIVTGSNTGLGLEAARHFARLNCKKLVLAVRSTAKANRPGNRYWSQLNVRVTVLRYGSLTSPSRALSRPLQRGPKNWSG